MEVNEPLDTAVLLHQGADAGHDDGDDGDVIHGGNASTHHSKNLRPGKGAGGHAHDKAEDGADDEDDEHVHPASAGQDHQIGQHLPHAVRLYLHLAASAQGEGHEDQKG